MISNLSAPISDQLIDYPALDSQLPFSTYISQCQSMIRERRPDLNGGKKPNGNVNTNQILLANSPFELKPSHPIMSNGRTKYGALLIHGLFDSPFSLLDLGLQLQEKGIMSRAILLPGHGTTPDDLLKVTHQDWIQSVKYGIQSLQQEVDEIYIIGFSTGAALAVNEALVNSNIKGIILLAPAIKIKMPVDLVIAWHYFLSNFRNEKDWVYKEEEINYVKYRSVPFNAVRQVSQLTDLIDDLNKEHALQCPVFMSVSREDETISSNTAMDFFTSLKNEKNELLLYSSYDHIYPDKRITTRDSYYPDLNINHFSHIALPFSPNNYHYGQHGDYVRASHIDDKQYVYGAYNYVEISMYDTLHRYGLVKQRRHELTYNPDFDFLANRVLQFILG